MNGPYVTITVEQYNLMKGIIGEAAKMQGALGLILTAQSSGVAWETVQDHEFRASVMNLRTKLNQWDGL